MIDKEFVPYEQALELKEIGFDEPCFGKYDIYGVFDHKLFYHNHDADTILNCSAPTFSQCFRWFREKYDLHSYVSLGVSDEQDRSGNEYDEYTFVIEGVNGMDYDNYGNEFFTDTYEEAELACLIKLIQIVKDGNK